MAGVVGTGKANDEVGDDMQFWYSTRVVVGSPVSSAEHAIKEVWFEARFGWRRTTALRAECIPIAGQSVTTGYDFAVEIP